MPDENPTQPPETSPGPNEPSSPPTEPAPGTQTEFRYGADAGHLAGKTPAEAVDIVNKLATGYTQLYQQASQLAPQAAPKMKAPDADLMLTNPEEWQRQYKAQIQTEMVNYMNQAAAPLVNQTAQASRYVASQGKYKDVFEKYGHEVEMQVANIPIAQRTPELWEKVAQIVKGEHAEDLAQEYAQRLVNSSPSLHVPGTAGTNASGSEDSTLWEKLENTALGKRQMEVLGRGGILKHIAAEGMTMEKFVDSVVNSGSAPDPSDPRIITNTRLDK